jgi:hypothetical protein
MQLLQQSRPDAATGRGFLFDSHRRPPVILGAGGGQFNLEQGLKECLVSLATVATGQVFDHLSEGTIIPPGDSKQFFDAEQGHGNNLNSINLQSGRCDRAPGAGGGQPPSPLLTQ